MLGSADTYSGHLVSPDASSSVFMGAWSEGGTIPEAEFPSALRTRNESCAYVYVFHYHFRSTLRYFQRSERSGRRDDSSPARLITTQAALLKLRGQQAHGRLRAQQHLTTLSDQRRIQSAQAQPNLHDLSGMHHQHTRLRLTLLYPSASPSSNA